ncbi:hypothetical protein QUA86_08830, partial [Microcoleus sp. F6_B6]
TNREDAKRREGIGKREEREKGWLITVPLLAWYFAGGRDTPQAFDLSSCTILNQAFRGGLEDPTLKEIHSLWNRQDACS